MLRAFPQDWSQQSSGPGRRLFLGRLSRLLRVSWLSQHGAQLRHVAGLDRPKFLDMTDRAAKHRKERQRPHARGPRPQRSHPARAWQIRRPICECGPSVPHQDRSQCAQQLDAEEPAKSAQPSVSIAGTQSRANPRAIYPQIRVIGPASVRWIAFGGKVLRIPHHLHDINWRIRVHVRAWSYGIGTDRHHAERGSRRREHGRHQNDSHLAHLALLFKTLNVNAATATARWQLTQDVEVGMRSKVTSEASQTATV
jgi:hypothetical protein